MKEEWAKRLDERMAGYEQPADESLWAGIAKHTAAGNSRRWLVVAAALAVAASVTALIILLRGTPGNVPAELPHRVEEALVTKNIPSPPSSVELGTKPKIKTRTKSGTMAKTKGDESTPETEKPSPEIVEIQDMVVLEADSKSDIGEPRESVPVTLIEEASSKHRRLAVSTSIYAQTSPWGGNFPRKGREQEAPEAPGTGNPDPPGVDNPFPPEDNPPEEDGTDSPGENGDSAPSVAPRRRVAGEPAAGESTLTHSFPVQVGARVSFSWGTRWSLESGLTYMHFNSRGEYIRQNMEYLGIPLYLNCSFVSTRYFSLYGSVGGQALKCIAGNSPDKPWLFSTGMGLGAEYRISQRVSIFAEPGLDWYFHTGESRNYYTENPFAFSVSAGIRFHLLAK